MVTLKHHFRVLQDKYTIIKDTKTLNREGKYVKRTQKIKKMDKTNYKNIFISYSLVNMKKNHGYWATVYFTPNIEVKILGLSLNDEKIIHKKDIFHPNRKILGSWLEDRIHIANNFPNIRQRLK